VILGNGFPIYGKDQGLRLQWKLAQNFFKSGKEDRLLSFGNMDCHFSSISLWENGYFREPLIADLTRRMTHTLSPSFLESHMASGAGSMSAALAGKAPGPVDGGSTFYSGSPGPYHIQAEQGMELELEYDEHSLDELEQPFLEETIGLMKDQNKEVEKENP